MKTELSQLLSRGKDAYEHQRYAEAFEAFSQAIHQVENHDKGDAFDDDELAELYALRGASLAAQNPTEALNDPDLFNQIMDDYDQAIDIQPYEALYLNLRGEMYLNCNFTDFALQAKQDFEHALKHLPGDPATLNHLGEACTRLQAWDDALYYLTLSLESHRAAETFRLRGIAYLKKPPSNFPAAADDFAQAILLDPDREELYEWRAQSLLKSGNADTALEVYDQLTERFPHAARHYAERAVIKMEAGESGAMEDLNQALSLAPHAEAFNNRAFLHLEAGNFEQAISDAQRALETDPELSIAYATLAEIYATMGSRDEFYSYLQLAKDEYYDDIVELLSNPLFVPYQNEERFREVIGG